jgi:hypothetical protein
MTITFEITKTVSMGSKPVVNVDVTQCSAASDEMYFAAKLTNAVVEFANKDITDGK